MFKHSAKISFVQNVRKQVYPLKIENVEKATNILRFRYMYILLTFLLRGMYIFVLKPHKVKKRTDSNMIYLIQLGWQGCAPWSSKHRCLRPVSTCERCDRYFLLRWFSLWEKITSCGLGKKNCTHFNFFLQARAHHVRSRQ